MVWVSRSRWINHKVSYDLQLITGVEDKVDLVSPRLHLSNDLKGKYAMQISRIANDPEIARRIGGHGFPFPYTEEDGRIFLDMNRKYGKTHFAMDFLIFSENLLVGIIGLKDIDYTDFKAHVGYWIGREYWNKGYASEALSLVVDYAKGELGLRRLYTKVLDFNLPSLRVLMKNGFMIEGFERDSYKLEDGFHSMFCLGRIL